MSCTDELVVPGDMPGHTRDRSQAKKTPEFRIVPILIAKDQQVECVRKLSEADQHLEFRRPTLYSNQNSCLVGRVWVIEAQTINPTLSGFTDLDSNKETPKESSAQNYSNNFVAQALYTGSFFPNCCVTFATGVWYVSLSGGAVQYLARNYLARSPHPTWKCQGLE